MLPFGENIKKIRKKWEMDQSDFGEFMSVSKQMISLYETGNNLPKPAFIARLCKHSGVPFLRMYEEKILDSEISKSPSATNENILIGNSSNNSEEMNFSELYDLVKELKNKVEILEKKILT